MVAVLHHSFVSESVKEIEMQLISTFFSEILAELLQRIEIEGE